MKKITKAQIEQFAKEALLRGNPYIKKAIRYNIGNVAMYLYAGQSMTKEEIDTAYLETARKDVKHGYEERSVGYYDKWYRYSRADEGRAYDFGVRFAASIGGCPEDMQIIPCIH